MAKSDDRRSAILERLADHVLSDGLSASSLRALADAAETSDRMLLYYFKDKNEIITATLGVIGDRLEIILRDRAAPHPMPLEKLQPALLKAALDDDLWPYMRMWLEISALAAHGDAFYRAIGQQLGERFLEWGHAQLKSASPKKRRSEAAGLLLTIEGVLLLKSVGMTDAIKDATGIN
ncbi:MAG: TetR/AcrR family transcriptional regulator [Alphaproteobacteria bacterium]|nr:TetR/AcrR family transcriptional regulator [Alphaproteobacteria bacterium]